MHPKYLQIPLAAALLCAGLSSPALASDAAAAADPTQDFVKRVQDATGLEFWGYARGGFYRGTKGAPKGGYSLGGELQKYRLGNEGDDDIEFGIAKRFKAGGATWGIHYMPQVYNGDYRTAQAYTTLTGLAFAPGVTFWAGQRYRRVADIHILDYQIVEDGDNYGAGADGINMGGLGKLNIAFHTSDSAGNKASNPNNAYRANFQWLDIPVNPGGTLTLHGGVIRGDFAVGKRGGAVGLMHKQKGIGGGNFNNSLFLQASNGHAALTGKFNGLDQSSSALVIVPGDGESPATVSNVTTIVPQPGARQRRIADAVDFQFGPLGGQAVIGYQTVRPDGGAERRDTTLGGRLSYALDANIKLVGELGTTRRRVDGADSQSLNKATVALAFAPQPDFWSRPEFRIYATHAKWNDAARLANVGSFGADGRRAATTVGAQVEAWW
jgi:maltoporin